LRRRATGFGGMRELVACLHSGPSSSTVITTRPLKAPNATPLANVMLTVLHKLGVDDISSFGDSEGTFEL
jgi:hypothetical protein